MSTPNAADRSQTSGTVLVTGATGPHGRAVAAALLSAGWPVRALTRDPSSARARALADLGAEPVAGDMNDRESLLRAMHDTAVVYAVTTPFAAGPGDEIRQGEALIAAASEVQIPWLILALVASADRQTGVPHFDSKATIERRLRAARSHTRSSHRRTSSRTSATQQRSPPPASSRLRCRPSAPCSRSPSQTSARW